MRRFLCALAATVMLAAAFPVRVQAVELPIHSEAAILMEKETGQILYAKNEHEQLQPASVTKVMTLLLTMEAIDSGALRYDDMVTASDYASSMGGSQIFLAPGEQMSVEDLLKGVCVASGNDASVALAEHQAGVTELFVTKMNNRAKELGMNDTNFVNCNGLPAEGHVTSAYDIALMSRELILHHPDIRRFTTIWMDTLRDGKSELSNTNKLIRFYDGATGLKTGSTSSAGYCISATAERDGMELIAVTLKADTSSDRFEDAKTLLNYGFSTYALADAGEGVTLKAIPVELGTADTVQPVLSSEGRRILIRQSQLADLERTVTMDGSVAAPVKQGQPVGQVTVTSGEEVLTTVPILAGEDVPRLTWGQTFLRLLRRALPAPKAD
ncbi:MAG: D-alanyl-D-alanine carboxypeptidase [Oscillospiraceae bacterium]|nr:D-alanyl-D-alanine carboxypeptidase [Oscillospiraceae bacterium]